MSDVERPAPGPDPEATSAGIGILENQGHVGPFAMILSTGLFDLAYTPLFPSLVVPADRVKPLLEGPLLRSSTLNFFFERGVLVSVGADLLDLAIGSEIGVTLLQVSAAASPRYMFRVSERFTLRVKQPTAIVPLRTV